MLKKVGSTVLGTLLFIGGLAQAQDPKVPAAPQAEQKKPASDIPDVVARVGDAEISADEYKQQVQAILQSKMRRPGGFGQAPPKPSNQDLQLAMNALVDQKIVMKLAEKSKIKIEDAKVDTAIANIKQRFQGEGEFDKILKKEGLTLGMLTERIRESMMLEQFMNDTLTAMTKGLDTSDKVLMVRYKELKKEGQLNKPLSADVAHILVKVDGQDEKVWIEAKTKIDAARKRIVEGGEEFGVVASEVTDDPGSKSNGGLYQNTTQGKMVPAFDKLTFALPIGEVSEPFKTQFGWHILRVAKRTEAGVMPFEEVKEGLQNEAEGLAKKKAYDTFIENAKKDIKVEILYDKAKAPEGPA